MNTHQKSLSSSVSSDDTKYVKPEQTSAAKKPRKAPSAFRTISEVADELNVQQHVLRFWETKFKQVKPLKRGGGRRYYRPEDVELLKRIHDLLYSQGYTIKGVQKLLKGQGKSQIISGELTQPANESLPESQDKTIKSSANLSDKQRSILEAMLGDLKDIRNLIKGE